MEKYNSNSEATSKICGPGKRDEHLKTKRTLWTWHWDNVFIIWREGSGPLGVPECNHSNKNSWKPDLRSPLSYIHVEVFTCSHWQLLVQHMPHRTQQKCGDQYSGISCHMHLQCENSTLECLEHGICEDQTATPLHSTTRDMQNISVESRKKNRVNVSFLALSISPWLAGNTGFVLQRVKCICTYTRYPHMCLYINK